MFARRSDPQVIVSLQEAVESGKSRSDKVLSHSALACGYKLLKSTEVLCKSSPPFADARKSLNLDADVALVASKISCSTAHFVPLAERSVEAGPTALNLSG